jgi:hypothetical protein
VSRRLSPSDRVAAITVAAGVIVAFLPWYSYTAGTSRITVNGFRASLLGDLFFLSLAALALLLLLRQGLVTDFLRQRLSQRAAYLIVAAIAVASALDQLLLVATGHRSIAPGLILALIVVIGMGATAWLRTTERDWARNGQGRQD